MTYLFKLFSEGSSSISMTVRCLEVRWFRHLPFVFFRAVWRELMSRMETLTSRARRVLIILPARRSIVEVGIESSITVRVHVFGRELRAVSGRVVWLMTGRVMWIVTGAWSSVGEWVSWSVHCWTAKRQSWTSKGWHTCTYKCGGHNIY